MELVTRPNKEYYEGGVMWWRWLVLVWWVANTWIIDTHLSMSHAQVDDSPPDKTWVELTKLLKVKSTK